jgi:hypothetical protein
MSDRHPIFVVGAPRTGTTLVREMLNRHPRIHLFDEVHFFERVWDDRAQIGDLGSPFSQTQAVQRLRGIVREFGSDPEVADVLTVEEYRRRLMEQGRTYANLLRILLQAGADLQGAALWGDSSPQDVLYLPTILAWYPDARIVALVRDPRGFLASYKNYWRRGVESYRERYNPLTNSVLWKSYMTAMLEAERRPDGEAVLRLRYEDLTAEPERWARRLCEHVGVDWTPDVLDVSARNSSFEGNDADRPAPPGIFADSRERWREELTPTEIWVGEKVFGPLMTELGYEAVTADGSIRPAPAELARIAAVLPGRLYNLLFRSQKPFKLSKVRRVVSLFRGE